ncbi:Aste57867_10454 [Aphanomyces stellatus]|uniref:Aste57867_10454 protein n=1 Tax=Aphanomyces stellatus TaxID=120398 RepID=A0A485KQW4_9STRA|nr:hypothetical protein As57867_010414 [Aphanomyces stellatus]VFT87328.1 Aste57867_10454 [Aphanomyces stellatus]
MRPAMARAILLNLFFTSCAFVCGAAAIWSFVQPTTHAATIDRACVAVSVDFDVVCTSGVMQIGDFTRFLGLIGIAFAGCFVVYVIERLQLKTPPKYPWLSFFLYSVSKHKFERPIHAHWEHQGIYYNDKASAALTGLLSLEYAGAIYILDIKTWRLYTVSKDELSKREGNMPIHLKQAIPLVE